MGTSGCAGEVIGGLLGMMLKSFFQTALIVLIVLVGMYVVYFLINPKRALAQLRHNSRTCLQCQILKSVARGLGRGDLDTDTRVVGMFARIVDQRRLDGHLEVRFHLRVCTVSFSLDGMTHMASYDASKDVPDGGEEVAQPPAA